MRLTFFFFCCLFVCEMSQQPLDGLLQDLVQIKMVEKMIKSTKFADPLIFLPVPPAGQSFLLIQ